MASLRAIRARIKSVKGTQKITKAMQMVAAAKLRRSQDAAQNARPYAQRMAAVIANLAAGVSGPGAPKLLVGTGQDQQHLEPEDVVHQLARRFRHREEDARNEQDYQRTPDPGDVASRKAL